MIVPARCFSPITCETGSLTARPFFQSLSISKIADCRRTRIHRPLGLPDMLLPVFRDLIKPQWRVVLEQLKLAGGMPVSELARQTGGSYMAVKTHCEELTKSGYLIRTPPDVWRERAGKTAVSIFPKTF
jgi:biotin operon repressor